MNYGFLTITRLQDHETEGTFGVLSIGHDVFCVTLELPDKENASNISSIPAGQYTCRKYSSARFPKTWEITNVPNRSYVLFHVANKASDLRGCVGLGQYFGRLEGKRAVRNSGHTFKEFIDITYKNFDELLLTIREAY